MYREIATSILIPLELAVAASVEQGRGLVSRSGLPLLVVGLVASALGTEDAVGDGQLGYLLVLLDDLQFVLFGVADDYLLLPGERVEVAAELADEPVACR